MPTLPRYEAPQVGVSNQRQVQRFNRATDANPLADAVQGAANAVGQLAVKIQEGRTAAEIAKSDIELRDELDIAYREIENDTETAPEDFESKFETRAGEIVDRKSTRLNSSHGYISYAVFCLKKKNTHRVNSPR